MTQHSTVLCIREANGDYRPATPDEIFAAHRKQLNARFRRGRAIGSPSETREYLIAQLAHEPDEIFATLYLDNRHRIVEFVRHFTGTIDGCSVHPRAIVKRALELNAAAVILSHQHPSGVGEPSQADQRITQRIRDALALVDVRVLDRIIVAGDTTTSFAERGPMYPVGTPRLRQAARPLSVARCVAVPGGPRIRRLMRCDRSCRNYREPALVRPHRMLRNRRVFEDKGAPPLAPARDSPNLPNSPRSLVQAATATCARSPCRKRPRPR